MLDHRGPRGRCQSRTIICATSARRGAASKLGPVRHGISVRRAESANVAGNTLRRIGVDAVRGIAAWPASPSFAVRRTRITGNEISEVGPPGDLPGTIVAGILLRAPYAQAEILDNHVEREAQPSAQAGATAWSAVSADEPDAQRPIVRLGAFTAARLDEARTLVVNGPRAFVDVAFVDLNAAGARVPRGASAVLRGNVLVARGTAPAVSVAAGGDIRFGDNRCELLGDVESAVFLRSSAAIISSNLVRGGKLSLVATASRKRATVVGNATTAGISIEQQSLQGTPWELLNIGI